MASTAVMGSRAQASSMLWPGMQGVTELKSHMKGLEASLAGGKDKPSL